MRRLVEIVYDGKPEAAASIDTGAANYRKVVAKERARLVYPADGAEAAKLALRYVSAELGSIQVKRSGPDTTFVLDGGESSMATRKNDDETISFIEADPPLAGFEFVRGAKEGKRTLIVRDGQHEYIFAETK